MAAIAGITDMRKHGPPADIGTFQIGASVLVFRFTFSGTNYFVAIATGIDGWNLIYNAPGDPALAIEAAWTYLAGLGGGTIVTRGPGETWVIQTQVDSQGAEITWKSDWSLVLQAQNALNANVVNVTHDMTVIMGLHIIGNADNNASGDGIVFNSVTSGRIENCYVEDCADFNFFLNASNWLIIERCYSYDADSGGGNGDGIALVSCYDVQVAACQIYQCDRYGLMGNACYRVSVDGGNYIDNYDDNVIFTNASYEISVFGVKAQGSDVGVGVLFDETLDSTIDGCTCRDNGLQGIDLQGNSLRNCLVGNTCRHNSREGIHIISGSYNTITGNTCYDNNQSLTANTAGISIVDAGGSPSSYNVVSSNNVGTSDGDETEGILLNNQSHHNVVIGNTVEYITGAEIHLDLTVGTGTDNAVVGNLVSGGTEESVIKLEGADDSLVASNKVEGGWCGIALEGSDKCLITGNHCKDANQYNILLDANSDDNTVFSNRCEGGGVGDCQVANPNCDDNMIIRNDFRSANPISDLGTGTILPTIRFQFIQGTTFISADGSAKGWEINAEADMAIALGQLPLEVQQVVRIKIWAVALGAPGAGGQMHLDIVIQAGADDLAYTAEVINLANFDSVTTDYVATDVVHWSVDATDDADIDDLAAGMSLECKINGGTAVAPDEATNATFRVMEIEYV